jgi:hypothetical protein
MSEGVYLYRVLHTKGCDSIIYRIGDVVIIQKEKEKNKDLCKCICTHGTSQTMDALIRRLRSK